MDNALLEKFEANKLDFVHELAAKYLDYLIASAAFQFRKSEDFSYTLDDADVELRNEISKMDDPSHPQTAGTFLESKIFQKAVVKLAYDEVPISDVIKASQKKMEEVKYINYWNPILFTILGAEDKFFENCFPFNFKVVEWKNSGLFKPGSATLQYELSPFLEDFFNELRKVAEERGEKIEFVAEAPTDDNPYNDDAVEIPWDQPFTIVSKRIKHKRKADDVWDLFVLNPNCITFRMKLFVTGHFKAKTLKKILEENGM